MKPVRTFDHVKLIAAVALWVCSALAHPALAQTSPTATATAAPYPAWAYLWDTSYVVPTPDDAPQHVPGSSATFSWNLAYPVGTLARYL